MASIRTATQQDAASLARVQVETWKTAYRGIVPDAYLDGLDTERRTIAWGEHLKSPARILVAEQRGEVVGFVSGGPIRESIDGYDADGYDADGYDAELYAIYLLLATQRMGIGTTLVMELARRLVQDGFQSMAVWTFEANTACRFYERLGAVRVAGKEREIGGASLALAAYGWQNLPSVVVSGREK